MSSTKSQVAVATNIPNLPSGQQQKDYNTEEPLGRQNSFGLNRRGNMKGKHLTRSHAMREATSPPRTPTPRASESSSQMSPNGYQQQQQQHMDINEGNNNNNSNNKLHTQSTALRGNSPIIDTPTVIVTSQHKQQQQQPPQQHQSNVALCNEAEFPKLSPPKSKSGNNNGGTTTAVGSVNSNCGVNASCSNNNNQQQQRIINAAEGHHNNSNNNNNNSSSSSSSNNSNSNNKKTNGDTSSVNETHNKNTNNVNMNTTNANKNYNQTQQQTQLSAGNALQKALNVSDSTQSAPLYNSPMNYQLHPNDVNRGEQHQHQHQNQNQHQHQQQQSQHHQQQQSFVVYDKENRCPRNDSQNSMNSNDEMHYETQQQHHQQQHQSQQHHQRSGGGRKHRTNSNSKGSKPRLKNMGSTNNGGGSSVSNMGAGAGGGVVSCGGGIASNSNDISLNNSNNTSGFISRENSNEQYTDHGGTDLLSFFKETLNKNVKDRQFLLKIEKDLIEFVQEGNRGEIRFPQASSYNRMLIHRTAAFFGMEHNVDTETQQCVIVAPTKNTRIPEIRFKTLVINNRDDSRKSILKRDTHSFDEPRQSSYLCPERGGMLDRKAKSFEEREEDYDRARSRIFNRSQNDQTCSVGGGSTDEDNNYVSWTSSVEQQQFSRGRSSGKVLKIQNSAENRGGGGVVNQKSNNFGNYGASNQGGTPLIRGDSANSNKSVGTGSGNGTRIFSKQDSATSSNTSWRLSPSSSGYKTQTQSIRSESVTPSPTGGYGSDESHLPDHLSVIVHREFNEDTTSPIFSGLVWAVTDILNVPKGSILINPQTLQPVLNADGTVYHYDPCNMPPPQPVQNGAVVSNSPSNIYHTNQNNSPQQQLSVHNPIKKQHKTHQQSQQQFNNKMESTTTAATSAGCESVAESSTQTVNVAEEMISPNNMVVDVNYQEADICNQDENDECDNSVNGCLSITTTTSTKNYDRIEVQKFKNQATSPNIPINEKDDIVKKETPANATPTQQQSQLQQSQTPQQSQTQNRETPHSSRSTPFSNSDTLTKRSSEESRTTSWTQSYQAPDGSTVFHTTTTPNNSSTNPYCTTTYQQGPDGSIYAVPQGMIYAYPPPVEGEFQGYFMPVFDPSQQRSDTASLLQPGAQAIYPAGGATTMVPVAAYPTAQFTTTNGAPIYPSQVIYSGEQYQPAAAPLTATAPTSTTAQLQQIPMTTYPIGYPYPYNGYWGQTMTYYVPQQAVPATSLLAAPPPPPSAPGHVSHVAGGVNPAGPNAGNLTAGPSTNSSNTTSNSSGHIGNGNIPHTGHQNGSITAGYQTHVHTVGGSVGSSHNSGTTYYGTGRIKRPTPSHFNNVGTNGGHQVLTAASIPSGVTTATYQLGHAVPTLTLAAAAAPQSTAGIPATTDLSGGGGAATTTTMYALQQHATIFPANMFPYATNAAAPSIIPQSAGANIVPQATVIQPSGNPQSHITGGVGGQASSTTGAIHNHHHSNTVIAPFYTTTHHHAQHSGIQSGGHAIHAPGPSAIPIVDPATITNITQLGPNANSATYIGRGNGSGNTTGTSQSAPSTPHSMPSSSALHHSQRNTTVFSTPPIMNNNTGGNYNSTPQYYGNSEISHQTSGNTGGGVNNSNSPHNSYVSSSYEKRNNTNNGGGKKSLSYQSASLSRQNSTSGGGYIGKPSGLLNNANNNNETRASPSSSTNSRPHSIKRGGGSIANEKPQTPLLSGPPSFIGNANNIQNTNSNNNYQNIPNTDIGTGNIPIVNVSKPPIRLNASAAAFRQKGSTTTGGGGGGGNSVVEYRRNPASQRNSPATNASSSNDNSSNNSPNSIHNSSNAATPIATGCYAPSYLINAQNSGGEPAPTLPPSLYITTAPARGPAHIPPHLQSATANGAAVPAAAAVATASVPQQAATAVLGSAAAAAAAADVANAAAVAAAAATVAHHHHHQPLLGTYNPGASGLYFKYGHTYFAHPSVALPNSRRSPSTDLRPPIAQMAGMYPTVNMMIPAQPRHPGRHPNPNYKGTRPR